MILHHSIAFQAWLSGWIEESSELFPIHHSEQASRRFKAFNPKDVTG
jgi:hypothetical protein